MSLLRFFRSEAGKHYEGIIGWALHAPKLPAVDIGRISLSRHNIPHQCGSRRVVYSAAHMPLPLFYFSFEGSSRVTAPYNSPVRENCAKLFPSCAAHETTSCESSRIMRSSIALPSGTLILQPRLGETTPHKLTDQPSAVVPIRPSSGMNAPKLLSATTQPGIKPKPEGFR